MTKRFAGLHEAVRERVTQLLLLGVALRSMKWSKKRPKVVLIGAPFHSNLGDQAQTLCTEEWLRANYADRSIVTIDSRSASLKGFFALRAIMRFVSPQDLIFLHSGYHTTDLYPLENNLQKWVVGSFSSNQIVILPQTIKYEDAREQADVARIFNRHGDLTVLCRDDESFETAGRIFSQCRLLLYPDIVASKIGSLQFSSVRQGIQLCLRRDAESVFAANGADKQILSGLQSIAPTTLTDTNSDLSPARIRRHLGDVVSQSWAEFASYKVTVTDRYHGVIFSLIAGTPVVVLGSADHKLKSGVRWFPTGLFGDYVHFAASVEDALAAAIRFYDADLNHILPSYFQDDFYAKLSSDLGYGHK